MLILHRIPFLALLGFIPASNAYENQTRSPEISGQVLSTPSQYDFPILQNGSYEDQGQFPMPMCHGITLEEATIDQLQGYMASGNLTSVQLAMCYVQRILQTDEYTR
jgi:amidase